MITDIYKSILTIQHDRFVTQSVSEFNAPLITHNRSSHRQALPSIRSHQQ